MNTDRPKEREYLNAAIKLVLFNVEAQLDCFCWAFGGHVDGGSFLWRSLAQNKKKKMGSSLSVVGMV